MKHSIFSALRSLRHFWRHQQAGSTLVMAASVMSGIVAVAGLSVDVGRAYAAKRALAGQTQAAAFAGAYALAQPNATSGTVSTAVSNWTTANPVSGVTISGSPTPTLSCVTATSGLPSCTSSNPNVVSFTQSGTVPTYFLKAVGVSSMTVSATASAAKAGGTVKPFNVMIVVDATGSMNTADSNCGTIPGISGNPTRWQCALYSVQSILKTMPTYADQVGLMIFPGMGSQYSPTTGSCGTQPGSVAYYSTNIKYQIGTSFNSNYNDGAGNLNTATSPNPSPLVAAVGKYASSSALAPCLSAKGGQGSYAAEVITAAQTALTALNNNAPNVIIFLSDGDYGTTRLNNHSTADQCAAAVTAATAARNAGIQIYSVAYGASTTNGSFTYNKNGTIATRSGSCQYDVTTPTNACATMRSIASDWTTSDSGKFYSTDTGAGSCTSTNTFSTLPSVFQAISTSLTSQTKPRLLTQ
jgi:Flp pilus assembly protein TadG